MQISVLFGWRSGLIVGLRVPLATIHSFRCFISTVLLQHCWLSMAIQCVNVSLWEHVAWCGPRCWRGMRSRVSLWRSLPSWGIQDLQFLSKSHRFKIFVNCHIAVHFYARFVGHLLKVPSACPHRPQMVDRNAFSTCKMQFLNVAGTFWIVLSFIYTTLVIRGTDILVLYNYLNKKWNFHLWKQNSVCYSNKL